MRLTDFGKLLAVQQGRLGKHRTIDDLMSQYEELWILGLRPPEPKVHADFGNRSILVSPQYHSRPSHLQHTWARSADESHQPTRLPNTIPAGSGSDCAVVALATLGYWCHAFVSNADNIPLDEQTDTSPITYIIRVFNSYRWDLTESKWVNTCFEQLNAHVRHWLKTNGRQHTGWLGFDSVFEATLAPSRLFSFMVAKVLRCPGCGTLRFQDRSTFTPVQWHEVIYPRQKVGPDAATTHTLASCLEAVFAPPERRTDDLPEAQTLIWCDNDGMDDQEGPSHGPPKSQWASRSEASGKVVGRATVRCGSASCQRVMKNVFAVVDRLPAFLFLGSSWNDFCRASLSGPVSDVFASSISFRYYPLSDPQRPSTCHYRFAAVVLFENAVHFYIGLSNSNRDTIHWFDSENTKPRRSTPVRELRAIWKKDPTVQLAALVYEQIVWD